jgi:hypothetical protein
MDKHNLYPIIDDLIYTRCNNIYIVLPYYKRKKEIGPALHDILVSAYVKIISATPQIWTIIVDGNIKNIYFITKNNVISKYQNYTSIIIMPDD